MTLNKYPDPSQRNWEQAEQVFYPSSFYITHSLSDRVALGFGFFTPYGLGAEWPKENPLRYLGYKDDMKTFFFNPTIAVKLADTFSVGFGVSYIHSTVLFKTVDLVDLTKYGLKKYDIPSELNGAGDAVGLNAGFLYKTISSASGSTGAASSTSSTAAT